MKKALIFKTIKSVLLTSVFLNTLALGTSAVIDYMATTPDREAITETPEDYHLFYEDVTFQSKKDNLLLSGWWIPSQNFFGIGKTNNTIIFSHGYGNSRTQEQIHSLKLAKFLAKQGYNVLMFDFRNSGESQGNKTTIGLNEQYDLLGAIDYAKSIKHSTKIGLVGWSMGASTSILAGELSKDVVAVVADSPFSDLDQYLSDEMSYWTGLPKSLNPVFLKTTEAVSPFKIKEVSPYKAAEQYKTKGLFLIHSKKDNAISYQESEKIYQKAHGTVKNNIKLWLTNKGGHIRSYKYDKNEYEQKVLDFLQTYMGDNSVKREAYVIASPFFIHKNLKFF